MGFISWIRGLFLGSEEVEETTVGNPHVLIPENNHRKKFHRYNTPRGGSNCNAIDSMSDAGEVVRESEAESRGFDECGNCQRWSR